jgi:hypothetical protein
MPSTIKQIEEEMGCFVEKHLTAGLYAPTTPDLFDCKILRRLSEEIPT